MRVFCFVLFCFIEGEFEEEDDDNEGHVSLTQSGSRLIELSSVGGFELFLEKMEVSRSHPNNGIKKRPLTPVQIIRGVVCLVVFLSTAFMFLVYFTPLAVVILRLFSIHYSRRVTSFIFGHWLALWPFLFEVINRTKVVFYGDTIPARERVLLISNHRTEVDWMYLWDLALRKGCLGFIKYILKSTLMKLPLFGWGFHILEFIPVERKWEIDETILCETLSTFTNRQDQLWLAVFPEGTDYTEEKCRKCQKFAAESGLPVLKNVLLPKTRGFCTCLEVLRGSLDAVYDVSIAYKHRLPSFLDNVFGIGPSDVHIHVRRIPIGEIPTSNSDVGAWLMNKFQVKDQLLSYFEAEGHFPEPRAEEDLSTLKCSLNFVVVVSLTALFSYLTFFSSIWFKIYVGLSCAYLASATYFKLHLVPVFGFVKAKFFLKERNHS